MQTRNKSNSISFTFYKEIEFNLDKTFLEEIKNQNLELGKNGLVLSFFIKFFNFFFNDNFNVFFFFKKRLR